MIDKKLLIALDGQAGVGSTTLSQILAENYALGLLKTGEFYRAIALEFKDRQIDAEGLEDFLTRLRPELDPKRSGFYVQKSPAKIVDLSDELNTPETTALTARVARDPEIRRGLNLYFQKLMAAIDYPGFVIEGRDAATEIAPKAQLKLLLTARARVRATRRACQTGEDPEDLEKELVARDRADNANTRFLEPDSDVLVLDTSDLGLEEVVDRVGELIDAVISLGSESSLAPIRGSLAVVGRPNVGKSALVNRVLGNREAVVEDRPGVTRDRVSYIAQWLGERFQIIDTGGWDPAAGGLNREVTLQAEIGMDLADVILLVVDSQTGITDIDEAVAKKLQRQKKPVFVVANKADSPKLDSDIAGFWSLGLGEPYPVSAIHGRGVARLLDKALATLPNSKPTNPGRAAGRVALIGRPNVGKSSLLNKAYGQKRVLVDSQAGTTRDPIDALVTLGGKPWEFVDTAGLKRKIKNQKGADFYATIRTTTALQKADVALVLIDATEPIAEQDARIVELVIEAGRALVLVFNKWDQLDEEGRYWLEKQIERELYRFHWAPRVNISALSGRNLDKLGWALETAMAGWSLRINAARLNRFLQEIVQAHPHPVRGGKQSRLLFASQMGVCPPRFTLFTTGLFEVGYKRFLQRRLREKFGFVGSPVFINLRVREKRRRGQ